MLLCTQYTNRIGEPIQYRSLAKEHPWAKHFTSLPNSGVGAFPSVSAFKKDCPCHVYNDLMLSKEIIGQIMMYIGATTDFKVES